MNLIKGLHQVCNDYELPLPHVSQDIINTGHQGRLWFAVLGDFTKGCLKSATTVGLLNKKGGIKICDPILEKVVKGELVKWRLNSFKQWCLH